MCRHTQLSQPLLTLSFSLSFCPPFSLLCASKAAKQIKDRYDPAFAAGCCAVLHCLLTQRGLVCLSPPPQPLAGGAWRGGKGSSCWRLMPSPVGPVRGAGPECPGGGEALCWGSHVREGPF